MICIIIGTRPEIIKMSPLIRACEKKSQAYFILHTGQHYSYEMDRKFFEDLELRDAKYNLNVGGREYRKQLGMMIRDILEILQKEKPEIVFVQGDTNSVLAGALAANKLGMPVGHHEAGLRSHDLTMLEETNRIITDHVSDFLFAPTSDALKNLKEEGINNGRVFHTGNTIVDAVEQNLQIAKQKVDVLNRLELKKGRYIIATAHRAENVDNEKRLRGILNGLEMVAKDTGMQIIYPIHPRTLKNIEKFGIEKPTGILFTDPLGYLEFLQLEADAALVITDSGGLQEEACILKVPCVTVRDNTERPETIDAGCNVLAGTMPEEILKCAKDMLAGKIEWNSLFGDGKAGEHILDIWLKVKNI